MKKSMNIIQIRKQIDHLDDRLVSILGKRLMLVKKIGKIKNENGWEVIDKTRWKKVISVAVLKGKEYGLPAEFTKKIFTCIHELSIGTETEMREE